MTNLRAGIDWVMHQNRALRFIISMFGAAVLLISVGARADDGNRTKAQALVDAAIQMTSSDEALKLLWQATKVDPTFTEAYMYLGLYYNSRSDFGKVVDVYKQLVKYQPQQTTAYLNIGEAYMSFNPPKLDQALTFYRKAYQLDPSSSFAALRVGETLAQLGNRDDAIKFLKQASQSNGKNAPVAAEAARMLRQLQVM